MNELMNEWIIEGKNDRKTVQCNIALYHSTRTPVNDNKWIIKGHKWIYQQNEKSKKDMKVFFT